MEPHRYWVRPHTFLAGEYPTLAGNAHLATLTAAKISAVINLVEAHEMAALGDYRAAWNALTAQPITVFHAPIRDMDVPSSAQMHTMLDQIDAFLAAHHSIYVHCWGGFGRTGTVVGCWLVRHGMTGDAALAHLNTLRQHSPHAAHPAPEREHQRAFVRAWPNTP